MNRKRTWMVLLPTLLLVSVALAQVGVYDLSWWTVDDGGVTYATGGRFRLGGTVGQPDAGDMYGGRFHLAGGWWDRGQIDFVAYLPLVQKHYISAPDLVVESITATANNVTLVLRNIGTSAVRDEFWVDVYVNPTTPPTQVNQVWRDLGTQGLVWGVTTSALPILPGGAVTLSVGDAYFWPMYSYVEWPLPAGTPIYAQADSYSPATNYGNVRERHEILGEAYNNILGPVLSVPGVAGEPAPVIGTDPPASRLPARP